MLGERKASDDGEPAQDKHDGLRENPMPVSTAHPEDQLEFAGDDGC
jgi:hypothetical protein